MKEWDGGGGGRQCNCNVLASLRIGTTRNRVHTKLNTKSTAHGNPDPGDATRNRTIPHTYQLLPTRCVPDAAADCKRQPPVQPLIVPHPPPQPEPGSRCLDRPLLCVDLLTLTSRLSHALDHACTCMLHAWQHHACNMHACMHESTCAGILINVRAHTHTCTRTHTCTHTHTHTHTYPHHSRSVAASPRPAPQPQLPPPPRAPRPLPVHLARAR